MKNKNAKRKKERNEKEAMSRVERKGIHLGMRWKNEPIIVSKI